jgi:beta-lactamase class A
VHATGLVLRVGALMVTAGLLATAGALPAVATPEAAHAHGSAATAAEPAVRAGPCTENPFWSGFDAEVKRRWPGRRITAAVYDSRTGCQHLYRGGERVTTASVFKIEIMAATQLRAQRAGRTLTERERSLITPMIRTSDDPASLVLWNALGGTAGMAAFERELGLTQTRTTRPWGLTTSSAADRNLLLRKLVLGQGGPFNAGTRAEARRFLLDVTPSQRWGITAGVPAGWPVPLKNGFFSSQCCRWRVNTSGVVERPDGSSYVLTVLSDGWSSLEQGIPAVELVSRTVAAWNRVQVGPHPSAARFARELRRDVLSARPSWWAEQALADRIGASSVRAGTEVAWMLASPAVAATSDVVLRLHLVGLGRLPSPAAWSGRVAQLRTGQRSALEVADAIATSTELSGGQPLGTGAYVDLVHQRAFGRLPAPADRAFWVARLDRGAPRGELLLALAQTATVRWSTSRTVQTASAHLTLLRRLPTADEQTRWEAALWSGEPLGQQLDRLLASPEYRTRFVG